MKASLSELLDRTQQLVCKPSFLSLPPRPLPTSCFLRRAVQSQLSSTLSLSRKSAIRKSKSSAKRRPCKKIEKPRWSPQSWPLRKTCFLNNRWNVDSPSVRLVNCCGDYGSIEYGTEVPCSLMIVLPNGSMRFPLLEPTSAKLCRRNRRPRFME